MDRSSCIDELDACFVACEEAYFRLHDGGVAARGAGVGNGLLLAAATATLASESLSTDDGERAPLLLTITGDACRACIAACDRDGAHWLAPARDACAAVVSVCESIAHGRVTNGDA